MYVTLLSPGLGLLFIAAAVLGLHGRVFARDDITRLPRERRVGELIGILCLVWSAHHGSMMLEGGMVSFRKYIWMLVPIIAILAYGHLDYLFARALGGLLVLCVTAMLHGAFVEQIHFRPVYSAVCYGVGIFGLLLIGLPWRFRDLLGVMQTSPAWRRRLAVLWLLVGVVFVVMPLAF